MEVATALAAFQQVLQQVEHLRVPLGLPMLRCFFNFCARSQVLSSMTCGTGISIQVSSWLVVDLHAVLGGDVTVLSVHPGARVGGIPQDVVHTGLKPQSACRRVWGTPSSVSCTAME